MKPKPLTMPDYPSTERIAKAVEVLNAPLPTEDAERAREISRRANLVAAILAVGTAPHVAAPSEDDQPRVKRAAG